MDGESWSAEGSEWPAKFNSSADSEAWRRLKVATPLPQKFRETGPKELEGL